MKNDIKTKVKNNVIKQKQNKNQLNYFIKQNNISTKQHKIENEDDIEDIKVNAQRNAVNNIEQSTKFTALNTFQKTKGTINNHITRTSINTKHKIQYNNEYISKHSFSIQNHSKINSLLYKKKQ